MWRQTKHTHTHAHTHTHTPSFPLVHYNVPPSPDGVLSLWKGVADSGLMGEVLSSLQTELLATLKGVEVRSEKADLQETGEFPQWGQVSLISLCWCSNNV